MNRCNRCECALVPRRTWDHMTTEQRATARQEGRNVAGAKGLCKPCHWQASKEDREPEGPTFYEALAADRREDLEWMASTGETFDRAAQRIGLSPRALARWLAARGLDDLRAALVANNPRDHNNYPDGSAVTSLTGERDRRKARQAVSA